MLKFEKLGSLFRIREEETAFNFREHLIPLDKVVKVTRSRFILSGDSRISLRITLFDGGEVILNDSRDVPLKDVEDLYAKLKDALDAYCNR